MAKHPVQFWLMKTEPDVFSIDDLRQRKSEPWDGVRNYQARNHMRDMTVGDLVLFYHSNAKPPGVAGIAKVCREAYPDPTQFDPQSKYYDPKSGPDAPRWDLVEVGFVEALPEVVPLDALKENPELEGMLVIKRGMRLSVQPVSREHFKVVLQMGRAKLKMR